MPLIITRIVNIIGAGQDERHIGGRLARQIVQLRRSGNGELRLGNLSPSRDFINVLDVARAMVTLARTPGAQGVFNVCNGIEVTVRELVERFCQVAGLNPRIVSDADLQTGCLEAAGAWIGCVGSALFRKYPSTEASSSYSNITRPFSLAGITITVMTRKAIKDAEEC
jgi:nucleoside-diphosphate-sugar epimerase